MHPQTGVDACEPSYAAFAARMGVDPATRASIACDLGNATFARALYELILSREDLRGSDWWWTDFFGCAAASQAPANPLLWSNFLFLQLNALRFPASRPMVLSRNGGLGTQRIGISFSGDTIQHEATLDFLIQTTPTASNALLPWWSHDVGGFDIRPTGGPGDADPGNFTACLLLLRWYQASVTFPIFRQHCDHCERRICESSPGGLVALVLFHKRENMGLEAPLTVISCPPFPLQGSFRPCSRTLPTRCSCAQLLFLTFTHLLQRQGL